MSDTWITDIRHFLNEKGVFPDELPKPALNIANYIAAIIVDATNDDDTGTTAVRCRRRPGRKRCSGYIVSSIQEDNRIRWFCPSCDDNGYISGWEKTIWNLKQKISSPRTEVDPKIRTV